MIACTCSLVLNTVTKHINKTQKPNLTESENIVDIKQVNNKIKLIRTNGAKLDNLIQEAAIGCIEHAAAHGDVRPANQLWDAMPKSARRNALGMYLVEYGAIRVNTGKDKEQSRFKFKKDFETDVAAARAVMWFSFKPEKDLGEEFNLSVKLQSLLKAYTKALSDGQAIKATPDEIQVLESLAATMRIQENMKATVKLEANIAA